MADEFDLDPDEVRALADGMGTAGESAKIVGRGGALADGMFESMPGAGTPTAYHLAARRVDNAMSAVGTALAELSGSMVGAVISFQRQDETFAGALAGTGER